jgi:hypothetical protein
LPAGVQKLCTHYGAKKTFLAYEELPCMTRSCGVWRNWRGITPRTGADENHKSVWTGCCLGPD